MNSTMVTSRLWRTIAGLASIAWSAAMPLGCATTASRGSAETRVPPNIVLIVADDLGWRDVASYGTQFVATPKLDELSRQSTRFDAAYASGPVCSPSRAAILTGLAPARLGITDWIPGAEFPDKPLTCPRTLDHLPLEEVTIAERLHRAGYQTFHVGKWHLGGEGFLPQDQGFDVNIMGSEAGQPATYFWPYGRAAGTANPNPYAVRPLSDAGTKDEYLTDRQTDEAIALINHACDRNRPFFLYLPYYAVHSPLEAKPEDVERYRSLKKASGLTGSKPRPVYAAMLENLDINVGRVLDALRRRGELDHTLVIFTSDNGGEENATDNSPLRGAKGMLYEGGIRVPLLIRWPAARRAGERVSTPAMSTDLPATICEVAGIEGSPTFDGRSLSQDDANQGRGEADRPLFWHYPHYHTPARPPCGAVRCGDWKLIEFYETHRFELYNLHDDPSETTDLHAQRPEKTAELATMLDAWRRRVNAKMPTPRAPASPSRP